MYFTPAAILFSGGLTFLKPSSRPVLGMTCRSPWAPTQLLAFGSKRDSWYICAAMNRQSMPYWSQYLRKRSSNGEIFPELAVSSLRSSRASFESWK